MQFVKLIIIIIIIKNISFTPTPSVVDSLLSLEISIVDILLSSWDSFMNNEMY